MRGWFNIKVSIKVIHHVNRIKKKPHMVIKRCRKNTAQKSVPFHDENTKLGIGWNLVKLIKAVWENPTANTLNGHKKE